MGAVAVGSSVAVADPAEGTTATMETDDAQRMALVHGSEWRLLGFQILFGIYHFGGPIFLF